MRLCLAIYSSSAHDLSRESLHVIIYIYLYMNIRRIRRIRGGAVHTDTTAVMIYIRVARARKIYFRTSCGVVNVQTIDRRCSFRFGHCFSQCESYTFMYI